MTLSTYHVRRIVAEVLVLMLSALVFPVVAGANVGDGTCFGTGDKAAGECAPGGGPTIYIPMASVSVSPSTITEGESSTLSWSCTELSGQNDYVGYSTNFGAGTPVGSMTVSPSVTTTYSMICYTSSGVSSNSSATLTVNAAYPDVYAGATSPSSATAGTAVTLSSTVSNQGNATASSFANVFQISGVGYVAADTLTLAAGGSSGISASYTFSSEGSYMVRACADTNTGGSGSVTESDESNNCGAWTTVAVAAAPAADLTAGLASPSSATSGVAATLSATVSNQGNLAASNFANVFQINGVGYVAANALTLAAGGSSSISASYTFSSAGSYSLRACADMNTSGSGSITESNEGNNCSSSWTTVTVSDPLPTCSNGLDDDGDGYTDYPADPGCLSAADTTDSPNPPTANLSANPTTISSGDSSTLTWSSTGATSCTNASGDGAGGFSTGGATSGTDSVSPTSPGANSYGVTCTGAGGTSAPAYATVTVINPAAYITAEPTLVDGTAPGGATSLKWSAAEATFCDIGSSQDGNVVTDAVPNGTTTTAVSGITKQTRYTLSCDTLSGEVITSFVMVNVIPTATEF